MIKFQKLSPLPPSLFTYLFIGMQVILTEFIAGMNLSPLPTLTEPKSQSAQGLTFFLGLCPSPRI